MPDMAAYTLPALAVIAGTASFFSPCAFPLLPGYLSFYATEAKKPVGWLPGAGMAAAAGILTFNLTLGLVIALLGTSAAQGLSISSGAPNQFVRVFRAGIGLLLIVLGVLQVRGVTIKPRFLDALVYRLRPRRSEGGQGASGTMFLYGLGYNAAGMGCTGPILAGLMLYALSAGGFWIALSAFILFSLTMAGLMILVSGLVATSRQALLGQMKASGPRIKQISAWLLAGVGVFNVLSVVFLDQFVRFLFP
jgi:cytochrome c-type biogenesis protein